MSSSRTGEQERLGAQDETVAVDGADALDRVGRLTAAVLRVPVALVTLVSHEERCFAAHAGLTAPCWSEALPTALAHALCRHVIGSDAYFAVEDARAHPHAGADQAIRDLGIGAYAGAPLRDADGLVLGALCAADTEPHPWTADELSLLVDLAALASNAIDGHGHRLDADGRDALTGLPSRGAVGELANRAIRAAAAETTTAVVALGIDGFRLINEALGHAAGDVILRAVAGRLQSTLRPGDAVCRMAGDVFVVVCEQVNDEADALRVADRLRRSVEDEPYVAAGEVQPVSVSVGVVTASDRVEADDLLATAVVEMERAKAAAQKRSESSGPAHDQRAAADRLTIRNDVRGAHRRGEMSVVYQPVVRLGTGRTVGYEALLRWNHPRLGPVAPDTFIPSAEASGAIVAIGEWVLERACADLARWQRLAPWADLHVAVNVAPVQLGVPAFTQLVAGVLETAGLRPAQLTLEVTERTLLSDRVVHHDTLAELREMGVWLALDDFGTGYSSLAYLTRFPFDDLKIDKAFVDRMHSEPQAASIVRGIMGMARGLGLRTIAEGVESPEQAAALTRNGCELAQGYLFAKPLAPDDVLKRLSHR